MPSFLRRSMVGKGEPFYLKFWVNRPSGPVVAISPILNQLSLVAPQP